MRGKGLVRVSDRTPADIATSSFHLGSYLLGIR